MKVHKTISIDEETNKRLTEIVNSSALIQELLTDYFNDGGNTKEKIMEKLVEIDKNIAENVKNKEILQEKLWKINKNEALTKEIFRNIPEIVSNDFKLFPKLNVQSLKSRYDNIYKRKYTFSWEQLLEAYKSYFNIETLSDEDSKV